MSFSLDTETTGKDLAHGAKPFLVTMTYDNGEYDCWEWFVNPETREPEIPDEDVAEIRDWLTVCEKWGQEKPDVAKNHICVLQNSKFDARALATIGIDNFPWRQVHDTLIAGHVLGSNLKHDLTSAARQYLGHDIQPLEDMMEVAVKQARAWVRKNKLPWRIAQEGMCDMPSVKKSAANDEDKSWKYDCWLPRAAARYRWEELGEEEFDPSFDATGLHPWWTATKDYANGDSEATMLLWPVMFDMLRDQDRYEIYFAKLQSMRILFHMEQRGTTMNSKRMETLHTKYRQEADKLAAQMIEIAQSYGFSLELPKGNSSNKSLQDFCFGVCRMVCPECKAKYEIPDRSLLPKYRDLEAKGTECRLCREKRDKAKTKKGKARVIGKPHVIDEPYMALEHVVNPKAKTDKPALDSKNAIPHYLDTLAPDSREYRFIKCLKQKREKDTALSYISQYSRFMLPLYGDEWWILFPNINPTGTDTTRFSSNNPNEQNIGKKADAEGYSLRYIFGPSPGREWWSLDAQNIELRIPAYESGEAELIALFERPNEPPYFGSNHLLISHLLFPQEFEEASRTASGELDGRLFKDSKKYINLYKRVKNGNFAVQYGAVDREDGMGTADRTYGLKGAQARIKQRFAKLEKLNQYQIAFANKHGYVETMPDRTVNPRHGYPLLVSRNERYQVKPTVPLNYHVQGTAGWWMLKAMIRCQDQIDKWHRETGFDGFMALTVHDELVFDFPKSEVAPKDDLTKGLRSNVWRIRILRKLMEEGGRDIGVPTPVSVAYNPVTWATDEALAI